MSALVHALLASLLLLGPVWAPGTAPARVGGGHSLQADGPDFITQAVRSGSGAPMLEQPRPRDRDRTDRAPELATPLSAAACPVAASRSDRAVAVSPAAGSTFLDHLPFYATAPPSVA